LWSTIGNTEQGCLKRKINGTMAELTISEKRTKFHDFELDVTEFDHFEMIDFDYLSSVYFKFVEDKKTYANRLFFETSECDVYVHLLETRIIDRQNIKKMRSSYCGHKK